MLNKLKPTIAIIDSGIGGITVLNKLIKKYKTGNYIYYADNLYMPYGKLSKKFLLNRILYIINYLKTNYLVDKIIVACNTASSVLYGLHTPDVYIMEFDKNCTYFATPLTKKCLKHYNVISDNTLAKQIERNIFNKQKLQKIIIKHVNEVHLADEDSIVLACTHFELVENMFKSALKNTKISTNSSKLLERIEYSPQEDNLNIHFILSKPSLSYYEKLNKLIGR